MDQGDVVMSRPRVRPFGWGSWPSARSAASACAGSIAAAARRTTSAIRRPDLRIASERSPASGARAWAPSERALPGSHRSCHGQLWPDLGPRASAGGAPQCTRHRMKANDGAVVRIARDAIGQPQVLSVESTAGAGAVALIVAARSTDDQICLPSEHERKTSPAAAGRKS